MIEAYSLDGRTRYRYSGEGSTDDAVPLDDIEARRRARSGEIRCPDPACKSKLSFVSPTPARRAHWRHSGGSECSVSTERVPEGAWHLRVKNQCFGGELTDFESHLILEDGRTARVDALVSRPEGKFAVEVQHSPISYDDVVERTSRHRDFGLRGTVWAVDASAAGLLPEDAKWLVKCNGQFPRIEPQIAGDEREKLCNKARQARTLPEECINITSSWVTDLIYACSTFWREDFKVTVLLMFDMADGFVARRLAEGSAFSDEDRAGWRVMSVGARPIPGDALHGWTSGEQGVGRSLLYGHAENFLEMSETCLVQVAEDGFHVMLRKGHPSMLSGTRRAKTTGGCTCPFCEERMKANLLPIHRSQMKFLYRMPSHMDAIMPFLQTGRYLVLDSYQLHASGDHFSHDGVPRMAYDTLRGRLRDWSDIVDYYGPW